jgi:RNA polymerase sigma-70 factor (ECF subfamily)
MALTADELVPEIPNLLRYARALTRDPDQADDLVQDVVLRALERAETFRGDASAATWLHRVMHHRFVDLTRARTPEPVADDELAAQVEAAWRDDSYTVDALAVTQRAQERDDLFDALVHLPAILRSAVVLHDMEALTSAEVAGIQGVTLPAAKQRLRRGRSMLVSLLADDSERLRAAAGVPMRCWQARSKVDDYLDDELTAGERTALELHLEGCPTCPGLYTSIVGVTEALGRLRDPDSVVPPALAARIREVL